MLSNREEKIVAPSMKSITLDLLKDIVGEEEATTLGAKLDSDVTKIIAEMHDSETISEDKMKKYISCVGLIKSEEKFVEQISKVIEKEGLNEDQAKVELEAVRNRLNAINDSKRFADDLYEKIKSLKHHEILTNKDLHVKLTEFFKDKITTEEELKKVVDAVEKQFLTEYEAKKDYHQARESIVIYGCDQLYHCSAHIDKLNIVSINMYLGYALDEYRDVIDKKYDGIYDKLSENFFLNLAEIMEKMGACLESFIDKSDENSSDSQQAPVISDYDLIKMFKSKFSEIIDDLVTIKEKIQMGIAIANSQNQQETVLNLFKLSKQNDDMIKDKIATCADWFLNIMSEKFNTSSIDKASFKDDVIRSIESNIADKMLMNTVERLNANRSAVQFFKAEPTSDKQSDDKPSLSSPRLG